MRTVVGAKARAEKQRECWCDCFLTLLFFLPPFFLRIVCHATRKEASSQRAEETRGDMNGREEGAVARLRWLRPPRRKEGAIMAGPSLRARNSSSSPLNNARRKIPHLRPRWRPAKAGAGRTGGPAQRRRRRMKRREAFLMSLLFSPPDAACPSCSISSFLSARRQGEKCHVHSPLSALPPLYVCMLVL